MAPQGSGGARRSAISVGKLGRPHGTRGEIKFDAFFGADVIERLTGARLILTRDNPPFRRELVLESVRPGPGRGIAKFEGYDAPETVREITNCSVAAPRGLMPPLPPGRYYTEEIIGLPVTGADGAPLGELAAVYPAGGRDVWEIRAPNGGQTLIPCAPETLVSVDLERGVIVMRPPEEEE